MKTKLHLLLAAAALSSAASAQAAVLYKDATTTDLNALANWTTVNGTPTSDPTAFGANDQLRFNEKTQASGTFTTDLSANLAVGDITVDSGAANGGSATANFVINSANGSTLTLNKGGNTSYANSGIVMNSGTGGTLTINSNVALGASQDWTLSRQLTVGGAVNLGANNLTVNTAQNSGTGGLRALVTGAISGSGNITKTGNGALQLLGDGTNYTGTISASTGWLALGLNTAKSATATSVTDSAGLMVSQNGTTTIKNISVASTANLRTDYNAVGGTSAARDILINQTVDGAIAGNIVQGDNGRVISITKAGAATLTISSASNQQTGTTTVNEGTLKLGSAFALGGTAAGTTVNSGGVLDLNGQTIGAEALTLNGTGISSAGALVNSSVTAASYAGAVTLGSASSVGGSGNITLGGNIAGAFGLTKVGAGTLTLNGTSNAASGIIVELGTLKAGNATAFGSGAVTVSGGALDLAGYAITNNVTLSGGSITNSAGTGIAVNNLALGTTGSVNTNGQTLTVSGALTGSGSITGNVAVNGTLAVGNSPGLISVTGDTTLTAATTSIFELGGLTRGTEYDALNVSGLLTLDGTMSVVTWNAFDTTTLTAGTSFDLIDWGTLDAAGFDVATDLDLSSLTLAGGLAWDTSGFLTDGTIAVTAVPEPSTYGLLGAGALAAVAFVRRRRKFAGKAA